MSNEDSAEERNLLATKTEATRPAVPKQYGPPASEQEWAELHRDMAPRSAYQFDRDERIGLTRLRDWEDRTPSAAESALTVERHGHTVKVDSRGLLIDGQRVSSRPLTKNEAAQPGDPYHSSAFQVTDAGAVVYHGRVVAALARDREPLLYGEQAPAWARGAGHTVVVDSRGILIDGQRVAQQPMPPPGNGNTPVRIGKDGRVFYGDQVIANLTPNPKDPAVPPIVTLQPTHGEEAEPKTAAPEPPPAIPHQRQQEIGIDEDMEIEL
ncbi:hypothetical protein OOK58_59085 [Streptomyces sp. NBC_01728]|uniref:hypothetical protein n=1 Tax=unclassified Streptomyces TaxID=2593676 RepID=UPI0022512195|nr:MULTISPECIES: hypothetical protein [unclassified Streptomyces]MCX4462415.1 hypothetical protein [Streptomyces sp. NBC_01719]MCX4500845.1 hypothetical protein [Streptomyces sp. NBC_01728]